ncbi:conserved hypothetical protein [Talaromyces stipitatus ATCC 10500]|uniref:Uncharacterized protein n=1 Tax=Talaromyces stipitatus (strain ATCC 10500 / CBS 375.48 / QM 6759 / NRRL 1006) TaxID=441959 RepID=B8MRU4_TALSN|nr:uncharacterized protein TSTA_057670 [Talaromyces stipitatus ATCC 10500]EED13278.1 conserved hypothetical protein [Talaromyces stipitatus ATCC 10500]
MESNKTAQGNAKENRPRKRNPMNLTVDTSRATLEAVHSNLAIGNPRSLPAGGQDIDPSRSTLEAVQTRFPLSSPITHETPSPQDSGKTGNVEAKILNVNVFDGGAGAGAVTDQKKKPLNLSSHSALSKSELESAIYARLLEQARESRHEKRRDMATTSADRNGAKNVLRPQSKRKSGGIVKRSYQQQHRPPGLQVLTDFSRDDDDEKGHSFLDLSDLKSIARAREKERSGEDYSSSQSLQEPQARISELSPSDRPIMIGLTVPYESTPRATAAATTDTIDSASSRTPATPSIMITPAQENPPWNMDVHMDMSTSAEMLHRPRVASSVYSQPSPRMMYDENAPPVPAIPVLHSVTSLHDNLHSLGTDSDVDETASKEKGSSRMEDTNTKKNMKKLLHKLSVNTSDANRPDSQGWWTYLLSPLLSRSNTVSSRRTGFSPKQGKSARSPLSGVSSPPQLTTATEGREEESEHWWDDTKEVVGPSEKSHFSPDTPEDLTRHAPVVGGGAWDMPFSDTHTTITPRAIPDDKTEKTRSVFQTGNTIVPNYELQGAAAEYYQASAHDLYHRDEPYFECINHTCSMTSAKRRAKIEEEQRRLEEEAAAAAAESEKRGGLAVFVFDPSRDPDNPFIAFLEKRVSGADVKEVEVRDAGSEKEGEEDGEGREVGEEMEKSGLSNARQLLSFDSSDEEEGDKDLAGKDHTASRSLHGSPEMVPTSRAAPLVSSPVPTPYDPSVSVSPPASYSKEMNSPAPVAAPAPVISIQAPVNHLEPTPPAPAPVQMPMMPPPQPRNFSPEPVPMPPMPQPQPRAISLEPFPMPMSPAPASHRPVPMPMPASRSPPVNERAPVATHSPPVRPPSNDTARGRAIPSGYQWEPVPIPRAISPPRSTRAASFMQPPAVLVSQSREVEESTLRQQQGVRGDTEPAQTLRPVPSFHRPGPFSASRSATPTPASGQPQPGLLHTADGSESETELPPYSAADRASRNAPRPQTLLPTYSARSQSERGDQQSVGPAPVSPGLQQAMTSRGGIPMSDVDQRGIRDMNRNGTSSISRTDDSRTVINVNHYYNSEHPHNAPEPPRPGKQFIEADLQARDNKKDEEQEGLVKKFGDFWRKHFPVFACLGRSGFERKMHRRWYAAIIAFCMLVIILSISLATTLTHKGDTTPVESGWLNITGFPPIPTGIMTVAGPAPAVERSSCIAPTQAWSCALPPEQQATQAGGYAPDSPNFRIEIRFRNDSSFFANSTSNSTSSRRSLVMFDRKGTWDASPAVPRLEDQIFLGNTTDNITMPFQGEDTPFYITFQSPFDVTNTTAKGFKRDVASSATEIGTAAPTTATTATHVSATGTGTASSTGTSTGTKTQATSTATSGPSDFNVNSIIPAPDLASDGTAAAATLYPLPVQQPIKLYNRGLPTEHYGFFTYFDKSIFLASDATITGGTTDTDSRDTNGGSAETEASARCTWSQTRFLVQIWTQPQNLTHMSLTASSSNTTSAPSPTSSPKSPSSTAGSSSANNFTSPGSFPYPITITIDRHGGLATQKLAYCYGIEQHTSSPTSNTVTGTYYNLTNPKLQAEQRESGGTIVQPSPDYFVLAEAIAQGVTADQVAPVDGGNGGCMCQWRNWIEIH